MRFLARLRSMGEHFPRPGGRVPSRRSQDPRPRRPFGSSSSARGSSSFRAKPVAASSSASASASAPGATGSGFSFPLSDALYAGALAAAGDVLAQGLTLWLQHKKEAEVRRAAS